MTKGNLPCVLVADPPWKFGDKLPGKGRGAEKNYRCLTVKEICNYGPPEMADDSYLFLWRVSSMVEEAYQVVRAWGFTAKSEIVWQKLTKDGKRWFGMGRYVRASHETCILAVRGRPQRLDAAIRSRFAAKVPCGPDGRYLHSAKPEAFYGLVERLAPGPYFELFGRRDRPRWTVSGDQVVNG